MENKIISEINGLTVKKPLSKTAIYENLLVNGTVKPNSQKYVNELIEYGLDCGLIKSNRIKRYKKKNGKIAEIFKNEDLIKMFDNVHRPKLAITMWLGLFCGLRISEACNLLVSDIDLTNKIIFVRNSKNTNRSKQGYGKDRRVRIPDIALSPIMKWLEIIEGGKWFIPSMKSPDKPIRTKTIHEQYRELLNNCNLSEVDDYTIYKGKNWGKKKEIKKNTYKLRFHTLRHFYATYLINNGVEAEYVSKTLGHESIDTTLKVYARLSDKRTNKKVNEAFNKHSKLIYEPKVSEIKTEKEYSNNKTAKEILNERLVRGEINLVTYRQLSEEISTK